MARDSADRELTAEITEMYLDMRDPARRATAALKIQIKRNVQRSSDRAGL